MGTTSLKHFDYLADHASDLETSLGLTNLAKDIDHWRHFGMEYPDGPLVGSRKIIESALVVDYTHDISEDEDEDRRVRYVHFSRARRRLYIRYHGTPPRLLSKYYADFLS